MHGYVPAASIANNDSHAHTFLNIPEEVPVEATPAPRVEPVPSQLHTGASERHRCPSDGGTRSRPSDALRPKSHRQAELEERRP